MKAFMRWFMGYLEKLEARLQQAPDVIMPSAYAPKSFDFLKDGGGAIWAKVVLKNT